jgi:hypothetical protein
MCEPSGVVAVPRGSFGQHFLVANDEDNTLRLYEAGKRGSPVSALDLGPFLNLDVAKDEDNKADIEAATWLGERIYWLGSHSRSAKGRLRPQRQQLFATIIDTAGAVSRPVIAPGTQPRALLPALRGADPDIAGAIVGKVQVEAPVPEEADSLAPEKEGLNIEGLSVGANGTSLILGLRNPLRNGKALLLRLDKPDLVIETETAPVITLLEAVELHGRGVRSLEYVAALGAYLIMAGPTGDAAAALPGDKGPRFQLFTWSGIVGEQAVALLQTDGAMHWLQQNGFQPEAMIIDATGKRVQLLSDDGDRQLPGGSLCKKSGRHAQYFRSVVLHIN